MLRYNIQRYVTIYVAIRPGNAAYDQLAFRKHTVNQETNYCCGKNVKSDSCHDMKSISGLGGKNRTILNLELDGEWPALYSGLCKTLVYTLPRPSG
jgi:hypothetical protein